MKYKHPLEIAYRKEKDSRKAKRILAIIFMTIDKKTAVETANLLRLDEHTVLEYLAIHEESGLKKLLDIGTSPGCPSKLTKTQKEALKAHVEGCFFLTSKEICAYVKREYGVFYTPNAMTVLLKKIGFSYKKPKAVPCKANQKEQQKFLNEVLLPMVKDASDERPVYFADATHLHHNSEPAYGWILKGKNKDLKSNSGRQRSNINGAYCLHNHTVVQRADETINAGSMIALFMQIEEANPGAEKIRVVVDNARYNHARELKEFERCSRIEMVYLPPYSPNLNLIERLWLLLKKNVVYNKFFESFKDFREAIENFFTGLLDRKLELRQLMAPNFQVIGA